MIFKVLSYISLALFIITGFLEFVLLIIGERKQIWNIYVIDYSKVLLYIFPIAMYPYLLYLTFLMLFVSALTALILMIKYRKSEVLNNAMFGKYSRFHFIPILCGVGLNLLGHFIEEDNMNIYFIHILIFIIYIIGISSASYISRKNKDFVSPTTNPRDYLKNGILSCLIALLNYCMFFNIDSFYVVFFLNYIPKIWSKTDYGKQTDDIIKLLSFYAKIGSTSSSILLGLSNLSSAIHLKDILILYMNCFIYIGIAINFFISDGEMREIFLFHKYADGIIQIVVIIISIIAIIIMTYRAGKKKEESNNPEHELNAKNEYNLI